MKKLFALVAICTTLSLSAQKIGHIHLDSLISMMAESKAAKMAGQEYYKQLESQVMTMQQELQTKYKEYQDNETKYTDLIKQTKQKELQDLNERIQSFQQSAQQDIAKKNEELAKPVYEKAKKAIEQVAKENGYKYILDTSSGVVVYHEASDDVLALAKKKLNITGNGALDSNSTAAPAAPKKAEPKK